VILSLSDRADSLTPSLIYSHRWLYHGVMRLLYGRHFGARYAAIAAEIPSGASVVDVCAGDGYLYLRYLRRKAVPYVGLDISAGLVDWAQRHGVPVRQFDARQDELPIGDVVIMQASLYQFLPCADEMLRKLLAAARQKVVITEPIRNMAASSNPLLALVGRRATVPAGAAYVAQRFNAQTLSALFHSFDAFERSALLPGGREMLGVFAGRCRS